MEEEDDIILILNYSFNNLKYIIYLNILFNQIFLK